MQPESSVVSALQVISGIGWRVVDGKGSETDCARVAANCLQANRDCRGLGYSVENMAKKEPKK